MRILVTGATCLLGRLIVDHLSRQHELRVYTRRPDAVGAQWRKAGVDVRRGDLKQAWTLYDALEGCDALLACTHVRYSPACVGACRHLGVRRYVQISSTRALSRHGAQRTVCEVRAGEEAIASGGLPGATILRPSMLIGGPGDGNTERLVDWFSRRRWFPVFGDGNRLVQPVLVDDVATAAVTALLDPPAADGPRVYTLAGGNAITYRRLLEIVAREAGAGKPRLVHLPADACHGLASIAAACSTRALDLKELIERQIEDRAYNTGPAQRDLGFRPVDVEEALRLAVRRNRDRH